MEGPHERQYEAIDIADLCGYKITSSGVREGGASPPLPRNCNR
jgi:hypothetical protein